MTDPELLGLVDLALALPAGRSIRQGLVAAHVRLNHRGWHIIRRQDRLVQQVVHLYLDVEDELSAVEKLTQGAL